jgi:hypothetical protein
METKAKKGFLRVKIKYVPAIALLAIGACARFQPTTPAVSASDYTPTGIEQGITLKDDSIHYSPAVLATGNSQSQVHTAFGVPNATRTTDAGQLEETYAFNPDGTKFVNPTVHARNIALAFVTMGTSVAVRQARLAISERKLTLFHVLYNPDMTVQSVTEEKLAGAPDTLPTSNAGNGM